MNLTVAASGNGFGAQITGVDLAAELPAGQLDHIRDAWLTHQVLSFPQQPLTPTELSRFALQLGTFGSDPFVAPLADHANILEVKREPGETVPPFGSAWHSDWSFQSSPPAATILHAKQVPSHGGDTLFADGYAALACLDPELRRNIEGLTAVHSARRPYSHEGYRASGGPQRSMRITPSDDALQLQEHPVIRTHPETGRDALWINPVYTVGLRGVGADQGHALLDALFAHATKPQFVHRVCWAPNMLTLWDNRCVMHRALGGYDGQRRVMHRITLAGDTPFYSPAKAVTQRA